MTRKCDIDTVTKCTFNAAKMYVAEGPKKTIEVAFCSGHEGTAKALFDTQMMHAGLSTAIAKITVVDLGLVVDESRVLSQWEGPDLLSAKKYVHILEKNKRLEEYIVEFCKGNVSMKHTLSRIASEFGIEL